MRSATVIAAIGLALVGSSTASVAPHGPEPRLQPIPIDHIIVIYLENRSFDHLYGWFPGADGIASAGDAAIQVNGNGVPYDVLPRVLDSRGGTYVVDDRFPELPN